MSIIELKNVGNEELNIFHRLNEKQLYHINEPDLGIFIAESPKVINRALDSGYVPISALVQRELSDKETTDTIERLGDIPIYSLESEQCKKITGFELTRGMLCAFQRKAAADIKEIIDGCSRIAILENVVNPTNIGAIFRSAAALNIETVLLTSGCCDPLTRRAMRVSMGNVFNVPWTYIDGRYANSESRDMLYLRDKGFKTVAMALKDNSKLLSDPDIIKNGKLAIILGTEGEGLVDKTIEECDITVKIPMSNNVDSLNVAAASAVVFWELTKKKDSF